MARKCAAKGTYYIDYTDSSGKRVRTSVGTVAAEAQALRLRKEVELRAIDQGLSVVSSDGEPESPQNRPITLAIGDFLEEVKLTKDSKTYKGYEIALAYFQESCPKVNLETLEQKDLLKFAAFLKTNKKESPRSVHNKFACLLTFLSANGLPKLIGKNDRPKVVEQEVEIYEHGELEIMLTVCSLYHVTLYSLLLMIAEDPLAYSKEHKTSYPGDRSTVNKLLPVIGATAIEDITPQIVAQEKHKITVQSGTKIGTRFASLLWEVFTKCSGPSGKLQLSVCTSALKHMGRW